VQAPISLLDAVESLNIQPDSEKALLVGAAILYNILGVSDAYACQRVLNENVNFHALDSSGQKFRLLLGDIAYLQLNLKFFALNVLLHTNLPSDLRKFSRQFSIPKNDVVLVKRLLGRRGELSTLRKHPRIQEVSKEMISEAAFKAAFGLFEKIYPVILRHIRNKTYQKLRFISTSSNMEFYDLNMELVCKAIQAYVKIIPTSKTEGHVIAYICRALNNHVVNMIGAYTSLKRSRMERGSADGYGGHSFEVTTMSENQLIHAFGVDVSNYDSLRSTAINEEDERIRDSNITYQLILSRFGTSPKRTTFLNLISIQEHTGFTRYLQSRKLIRSDEDNADYKMKTNTDTYIKVVCEFVGVSTAAAQHFMNRIASTAYPDFGA
jgi:hypothetical protein